MCAGVCVRARVLVCKCVSARVCVRRQRVRAHVKRVLLTRSPPLLQRTLLAAPSPPQKKERKEMKEGG